MTPGGNAGSRNALAISTLGPVDTRTNSRPNVPALETTAIASRLTAVRRALADRLYGRDQAIRLALTCLLADGHPLIEDMPDLGQITLARGLTEVL